MRYLTDMTLGVIFFNFAPLPLKPMLPISCFTKNLCFIVLICLPALVMGKELMPFTTDGCSSFPNGSIKQQSLWLNCCIRHDFAYWKGGTYDERLLADKALESCVTKVGQPKIALIMLAGVRIGGSPFLPTHYRWGYGWPFLRGYKPLSPAEILQVKIKFESFKQMIDRLSAELNR